MKYNGNAKYLWSYGADGNVGLHTDLVNNVKWQYQYDLSGNVISVNGNNGTLFNYTYGTGSVVQTSEGNGSLFLRYTYDPFGETTSIRSPLTVDIDDLNRYTYNGEDYDCNTGLQYLRARYYSTSTGNFISQDTYLGDTVTPLSQNRYTYCHNNPVMYDDPSGHLIDIRDTVNDILKFGNEQFQKTKKHVSSKLESTETYLSKRLLEANINLYVSNCEKGIEFDANLLLLTDYYDPEKGYYDFDNFVQIEAAYEYLAVKTLQNELYDAPDFVASWGMYFNINTPDLFKGFKFGGGIQLGYAIDKYGNVSPIFTISDGSYLGSSGFSLDGGSFASIVDAPTINDISGSGSSIGGSVTAPVPDTPIGVAIGAEKVNAYGKDETYEGVSFSFGIAPPVPGIEYHVSESYTVVGTSYNIFDEYDNLYKSRMRR